jgi:hypothetical protein
MKRLKFDKKVLAAAMVAGLAFCGSAQATAIGATAIYDLNVTAAAYGPGLFGKVTLTQQLNHVDVLVDLTTGYAFANTGSGPAFAFNLDTALAGATLSLLAPSADFVVGTTGSINPWGTFSNTIAWKAGAPTGMSGSTVNPIDEMTFSVNFTGIDLDQFLLSGPILVGGGPNGQHPNPNTGGFSFIADIGLLSTQATGVAGATGEEGGGTVDQNDVPEPGTTALFGLGLMGAAWARRRRKV